MSQGDVVWINDSKATNVGATVAALSGIAPQCKGKLILLAGGIGKDADFEPLKPVLDAHVDTLITFGRDGEQIAELDKNAKQAEITGAGSRYCLRTSGCR